MDPQACFFAFCTAVTDGELDLAADCAECYREWIGKGGFRAEDSYGDSVLALDPEQDRYGVSLGSGDYIENWRNAAREGAGMIQ